MKYRLETVAKVSNIKERKRLKSFVKSQAIELDTVFQSYKAKTKFDFNSADTIYLIYCSPTESPFTSDIIIWSGKDTIQYKQRFEAIEPSKNGRIIVYEPFVTRVEKLEGWKVVTERDSLVTLVSKREFSIISHLGDNQIINDGSYVRIYVAFKNNGRYVIESCFPKQFMIKDTYRHE